MSLKPSNIFNREEPPKSTEYLLLRGLKTIVPVNSRVKIPLKIQEKLDILPGDSVGFYETSVFGRYKVKRIEKEVPISIANELADEPVAISKWYTFKMSDVLKKALDCQSDGSKFFFSVWDGVVYAENVIANSLRIMMAIFDARIDTES